MKQLKLSFHSFFLAAQPLANETAVLYVHIEPTTTLQQKVTLIDRSGARYTLPLDQVAFILQKKGVSFLPFFKEELAQGHHNKCKLMLDSLIDLIRNRCKHNISDLDNMNNDNYGWLSDRAIHLDIGRFQEKTSLSEPLSTQEEILRVTHPLRCYLSNAAPELYDYFIKQVHHINSNAQ